MRLDNLWVIADVDHTEFGPMIYLVGLSHCKTSNYPNTRGYTRRMTLSMFLEWVNTGLDVICVGDLRFYFFDTYEEAREVCDRIEIIQPDYCDADVWNGWDLVNEAGRQPESSIPDRDSLTHHPWYINTYSGRNQYGLKRILQ